MATGEVKPTTKTITTEQRTAYKAGDKVEYDGKLAKVVNYGFLEIPTNPGESQKFSSSLLLNLQLPAAEPGGKPEYAYFVDPDDVKSLKDDPKRQRALEMEYAALFGDRPPVTPAEDKRKAPELRQSGPAPKAKTKHSVPRGKAAEKAPAKTADVPTNLAAGKTVTTSKSEPKPKAAKKGAKK